MEGEEGGSSWLLRPKLSTSVYKKSSSCRESSRIIMKSSAEPKLDSSSSSSSSTSQPRSSSTELSSAPSLPSSTTPPPGSETEKGSSSKNSTSKPKPALKNLESTSTSSSSSCGFSFYPDGCPELSSKFSDSNLPPTPSIIMAKPGLDARSRESRSENAPPKPRQRSSSPMPPATILSDAFKEAKSIARKRFSTPPRSRHALPADHRDSSPMRYLSSMKAAIGKPKARGGRPAAAAESGEEPTTIDLCKLYIGLRFASGAHSRLYHGMYEEQPVAVKIVRQPDDDDDDGAMAARLEKQFTREVTFLSHLSHRNVIKLAGACKTPQISCIITEYLSGGSLRAFLHKLEHKSLPLKEMIAIGLQIARGLEYIHSQGIIHRDIKPENILFDREYSCVKIADFGTACEEAHCDVLADDPGTYRWMAPEMLKHKAYGRKVDVYSFGLILWEMAAGTVPYEDMSPIQAAFAVVNKNMRPKIPACCPAAVQALIEQCWALHPEKRPEFSQIVKVLEQFESKFAREGTLDQLQNLNCLDHKKGLHNWIQKFKPLHADVSGPSVPKFL